MNNLGTALAAATSEILQRIVDFLPSLIGALLLVIAGWLIGRILRALTVRAALLVETLASRLGSAPGAEPLRMRQRLRRQSRASCSLMRLLASRRHPEAMEARSPLDRFTACLAAGAERSAVSIP